MCVGLRDIQYLSPDKKRKKVDTARPTPRRVYRNYDVSQSLLGDGVLESSLKKFGRAPAEQTSRRGRRTNKSLSLPSKKATTEELFIAFKKSHGSSLLHLPSFSFLDTKKRKEKEKEKQYQSTRPGGWRQSRARVAIAVPVQTPPPIQRARYLAVATLI